MRRATGAWLIGIALLGMAAAAVLALRPIWNRETIKIVFCGPGRDPIPDSIESGFRRAIEEHGPRMGRFRLEAACRRGGFSITTAPSEDVEIRDDPSVIAVVSIEELYLIGVTNGILCVECRGSSTRAEERVPGQACLLPPIEDQAACAARWLSKLGCRNVAMARLEGDFAPISRIFREEAERSGIACKEVIFVSENDRDRADRVLHSKVDAVFHLGEAPATPGMGLVKELRKSGFAGVTMILDTGEGPNGNLGTLVEGTHVVSPWAPPPAGFTGDTYAYAGYRAAKQVLDAIERADSRDRAAVIRAGRSGWPSTPECAGYVFKGGRLEFVELLK